MLGSRVPLGTADSKGDTYGGQRKCSTAYACDAYPQDSNGAPGHHQQGTAGDRQGRRSAEAFSFDSAGGSEEADLPAGLLRQALGQQVGAPEVPALGVTPHPNKGDSRKRVARLFYI